MTKPDQSLILVLGDQLSLNLPSLRRADKTRDVVLMAEVMAEASYVRHHKKKIALVFSAMRHFADELLERGWQVDYVKLDDTGNTQSLKREVERAQHRHGISHVLMTEPGEWRLKQDLTHIAMLEDTRFICSHSAFRQWAANRKELRMEFFYRDMRRQTGLLMNGDKPEGGAWNFDSENRKPAKADMFMPEPFRVVPDEITRACIALTQKIAPDHFGDIEPFWFAVTRAQAEQVLAHFLQYGLPRFGETQDAMLTGQYFLHHAVLSPYINLGLLDPLDVCRRAEAEYRKGRVPLASAEGFIRQIIGWREYIRGIYWLKMPDYAQINALEAKRPLPEFYWTGETDMNCIAQVVKQTRQEAYAHHIQRLMVTGNFALLAGLDPVEVHEWYLAVYADAYEWVELPNTIGMALHADGGLLGSKPYAASGNYINKMSDYCSNCRYDVKQRTGPDACPFNALYWDFIARHKPRFAKNPRMANICRVYDKFDDGEKSRIADNSEQFLAKLEAQRYRIKDIPT
jgi:deoxyribodipyrimidine photolyase-related protein